MARTEPEFFKQYVTVVLGTLLAVMTFAFIAIPLSVDVHATRHGPAGAASPAAQVDSAPPVAKAAERARPRQPHG